MLDFTALFWISSILFFVLSILLVSKGDSILYLQVVAGSLMFASSKIGRKFLGLE